MTGLHHSPALAARALNGGFPSLTQPSNEGADSGGRRNRARAQQQPLQNDICHPDGQQFLYRPVQRAGNSRINSSDDVGTRLEGLFDENTGVVNDIHGSTGFSLRAVEIHKGVARHVDGGHAAVVCRIAIT